nr:anti-sigma factor [Variovorax boronicumulans]
MDDPRLHSVGTGQPVPITEADLHAYADGQLAPARQAQMEQFLAEHPTQAARVRAWQEQNALLHSLLDPVRAEPVPPRLSMPARTAMAWRSLAAGVLIAAVSAGAAWSLRGMVEGGAALSLAAGPALSGFAQRAAIAHAVYSPDKRRPVEVGADQEQALVTWLTRRMGAQVRAPALAPLGYALIGGRLLPGEKGPVAQFMYGADDGRRLTLYVTREVAAADTAFRFGQDGAVKVFYWVENGFGYAISADADRAALMEVSEEVYRQLKPG